MTEDSGNGKVVYTVREMFTEIKVAIQSIDSKLENKAERGVVDILSRDMLEIKAERKAEREMGMQMLTEYRTMQQEHAQLKTDVSVLKSGKKDLVVYGGLLINFVGVLAAMYKLFVH